MKKILAVFTIITISVFSFFYFSTAEVDNLFIENELNKVAEKNAEKAKLQYGDAFKAESAKVEIKKTDCKQENKTYHCNVVYAINKKEKKTMVTAMKSDKGWELVSPPDMR